MTNRILLTLSVLVAMAFAVPAWATPNDVIADYFVDGQLNGAYSVDDLRGALAFAKEQTGSGAQYSAFADIVSQAITEDLAGVRGTAERQLRTNTPRARIEVTPAPAPATTAAEGEGLPAPPPASPDDDLPSAVPIMGLVALGLVLAGAGSAVWRRRRR